MQKSKRIRAVCMCMEHQNQRSSAKAEGTSKEPTEICLTRHMTNASLTVKREQISVPHTVSVQCASMKKFNATILNTLIEKIAVHNPVVVNGTKYE